MNNHEKGQGNADSTIQPAVINLTRREQAPSDNTNSNTSSKSQRWLWPALVMLLTVAAGVVFILPNLVEPAAVSPTSSDSTTATNATNTNPGPTQATPAASSPWAEAQEARQRQESQDLLSQLLKLQEELEDKHVEAWATDNYNLALRHAADGDAAYRERNFQLSSTLYRDAVERMQALLESVDTLFEDNISKGNEFLVNANPEKAKEYFELALMMKPEDSRAQTGLQRSGTLDQVLELITEGNNLQQNNELEDARSRYQQALTLDQFAEEAARQIRNVNAKILDRDFNRHMSEGYTQLQSNNLQGAQTSFQRALKLKPNASEARSGLQQTETRITNTNINTFMLTARTLEKQEKWTEALAEYDKALALDSNLAEAQQGKQYTANRAELDSRLEKIIAEPARLANKAVYEETRLVYQQLSTMAAPDPRLALQLDTLKNLLELAIIPVQVVFQSDNQTEVVIYRVGTLGKFEQKDMTLFPGNYVAVGTRQGYRDVRVEFTVATNTPAQIIQVSAVERIASR